MRYVTRHPGAPLGEFIEYFWSLSDDPSHGHERVVPSGTIELVVNLDRDEFRILDAAGNPATQRRFSGAMVSGCYGQSFGIDTRDHAAVVGVHFRPGRAAGVLGVPPGELRDLHVGLRDLWGAGALELRERLCTARSTSERFRILEQALIRQLAARPPSMSAIVTAVRTLERPGVAVGDVARELQLSRRRFIEIFTRDVGMAPKRYARVRRFQRALSLASESLSPEWAQIALAAGYYDQAHLCREWSEFSGLSPSHWLSLRAIPVKVHHLALAAGGSHLSNTIPSDAPRLDQTQMERRHMEVRQ
jgi:AraC-like DNA-binding protein